MAKHNNIGSWGEQIACETLIRKGYAIRERNWKLDKFEIDIIAMHNNRLIFVEVKTRSRSHDEALEAVNRKKIMKMVRAAHAYVQTNDIPHEIQYDIITIAGEPTNYSIEHIEDAFLAPLRNIR